LDIQEEFDNRVDPIVLAAYTVCKYKNICPYRLKGSQYYCRGTEPNRNVEFICDIQKLKN